MQSRGGIDLSTILGIIGGIGSLLLAIVMEFNELNPDLGSPFLKISALLVIFGGTVGATMLSFKMDEMMRVPKLIGIAFANVHFDAAAFVDKILKLAELARREGVLRLEQEIAALEKEDQFLSLGLRLVVDGVEPQMVEDMLNSEVDTMSDRHKVGIEIFTSLGGYAPTMGIIGTVVGLISALAKAGAGSSDSSAVVGAIATAFIATFYGIGSANLLFLPLAGKLKVKSQHETFVKRVEIEAIKAIQSGENPRVVHDKLAMLFQRGTIADMDKKGK
jgi:chemotaxis protein MotA